MASTPPISPRDDALAERRVPGLHRNFGGGRPYRWRRRPSARSRPYRKLLGRLVLALEHGATDVGAVGWDAATGQGLDPATSPTAPTPAIPLTNASWSLIGPAPVLGAANVGGNPAVSGRVAGIAGDPTNANILYLATAGGGAWKSVDAGVSWTPTTDGQSTLFNGAITVAPSNANVIYVGTGEGTNSGERASTVAYSSPPTAGYIHLAHKQRPI